MRSRTGAQDRRKPAPAWLAVGLVVFSVAAGLPGEAQSNGEQKSPFRFGFSSATLTGVNENDAKAALKVWSLTLAKERGFSVDPEPKILKGSDAIAQALHGQHIEAITMPMDEYWELREEVDPRLFIGQMNEGRITEEYVLLVHQDSGIQRIDDLRGRSVMFWQNSQMSLASAWLDIVLFNGGCRRAAEFCRVTQNNKLNNVILPVFFRRSDACVVTHRGFMTMSELNPQLSQRLKVLATSPKLVPVGFWFRRDYDNPIRK